MPILDELVSSLREVPIRDCTGSEVAVHAGRGLASAVSQLQEKLLLLLLLCGGCVGPPKDLTTARPMRTAAGGPGLVGTSGNL